MRRAAAPGLRPPPAWLPAFVKPFEGLHDGDRRTPLIEPMRDPVGFWTVGWGHLVTRNRNAPRPPAITLEEAEALLAEDLARAAAAVLRLITAPLDDCQYGALIDFAFNLGPGNLEISTLRRRINRGDPLEDAEYEFGKWRFAGGRELPGLIRRRRAEARLWLGAWLPA